MGKILEEKVKAEEDDSVFVIFNSEEILYMPDIVPQGTQRVGFFSSNEEVFKNYNNFLNHQYYCNKRI